MEFLKAQITRIQEQLGGLSATQKMLTASLLAIMVMTLLWWSYWAAEPEMSPLLDQSMPQDVMGQIVTNLDAQGITHKVVGDRVYVPTDRKLEILAELGYSQALPKNFDAAFDDFVKQMSPFDPADKTDRMYLEAKERTLSMLIANFPGVADAHVMIDPTSEQHFDTASVEPTATVTITTGRQGKAGIKQLASSAADVVSGAEAGLQRGHIKVVVDGFSVKVSDGGEDGTPGADEIVEEQKQWEDHYTNKIKSVLMFIPDLMVSVTVQMETSQKETKTHTVDPKGVVSQVTRSKSQSDETTGAEQASQQDAGTVANAVPNVAASIGSGGGGGGSTSSIDETEFAPDHTQTDMVVRQGPGSATAVSAAVEVPRSYFINSYKSESGGKDPDETTLQAYMDKKLAEIKSAVKGCTQIASDDAVVVSSYSDELPSSLPVAQQPVSSPMATALGGHGKEIAVGILAAISLFMMSMMVKKGAPAAVVAELTPPGEPMTLPTAEGIAGRAAEGAAALDGMELDEETLKAQQMVDQVQQMVQANPDGAANLVKRWLNR